MELFQPSSISSLNDDFLTEFHMKRVFTFYDVHMTESIGIIEMYDI